jgi:hypothetical protein
MAEALRTAAPRASEQRIRRTLGYSDMRASFELSPSAPSVAEKRTASVDVRASGPKLNPGGLDSGANATRDPRGSRYGSEHTPSMPCRGVSTAVRRTSCSLGQAGFQCVLRDSSRPGPRDRHDLRRPSCRTSRARPLAAHRSCEQDGLHWCTHRARESGRA